LSKSITYEDIINQLGEDIFALIEEFEEMMMNDSEVDISEITEKMLKLFNGYGRKLIEKFFRDKDEEIKDSPERLKDGWKVERNGDKKELVTVFGKVELVRTYYYRETAGGKEYKYLADEAFCLAKYQRLEPLVEAGLLDRAADNSYRKSGKGAVGDVEISDTTVMNKVHELEEDMNDFIREKRSEEEKREVSTIYIEADEDHVSLQKGENEISRLVYIHEGYKEDSSGDSDSDSKLKNAYYIAGAYKESSELWLEVADYLHETYNLEKVEDIFIGGDGARWIKEGLEWIPESKFILDPYHLNKYVHKATGHAEKFRFHLWEILNAANKDKLSIIFSELLMEAEEESRKKEVRKARRYIYNNWEGIKNLTTNNKAIKPSAEGHVSHILADRLSSRPMGWSRTGMDRMSRLRAFRFNGGDRNGILELIRRNRREKRVEDTVKKVAGGSTYKSSLTSALGARKQNIPALKKGKRNALYHIMWGASR